jgi:hypothetical protein
MSQIVRWALAVLLSLSALPLSSILAFTTVSPGDIVIDGDFSDWVGVRADPDNTVRDTQIPEDPDEIGQPDRDIYLLAATYDEEYLYFSWRRTAGGQKDIAFGAYLDFDVDGYLDNDDLVVMWKVGNGNPYASYTNGRANIYKYYQATNADGSYVHPGGDPMLDNHRDPLVHTGDGETPDGYAGNKYGTAGELVPSKTMDGYLAPSDGIECEAKVAWTDLGVSGPVPLAIHFASGNGNTDWGNKDNPSTTYKWLAGGTIYREEWRGQIEDNAGPIMWLINRDVSITPDNAAGGSADTTVTYTHTVTNSSNTTDTFDLATTSSQGWTVTLTDSAGNPIPGDAVTLGSGGTTDIQVHVKIPAGTADGVQDITTVSATSQTDSSVADSATDTTRVGQVTVTPDQTGSMAPGQTIEYTYTVQNNTPSSGTFDLSTTSTQGFTNAVVDAGGSPLSSVALASGESTTVVVRVTIPATATVGLQDTMRLTTAEQADPTITSSATGVTTVLDGLGLAQDETSYVGAGSYAQYTHTITNSWPTTRTVDLSALSSQGWDVTIYAEDGITEITSIDVGPNGSTADVILRVAVPSDAATGDEDYATLTATADIGGGSTESAQVTDHTIVRQLATFTDAGYVRTTQEYLLTDTVYALGSGLKPGNDVYFVWKDANGTIVRTSADRTVDTQGMVFDEYETLITDPVGWWTVELYNAKNDQLLEASPFFVQYKAEITELAATDAPSIGDTVTVTSEVENLIGRDINDSYIEYVIWWDSDGSGTFDAGDIYIDDTGMPVTWDGTSTVTVTHTTTNVDVPGKSTENDSWDIANTHFPNQGTYQVTATWYDSTGTIVIDEETTSFYSIPALGWPLFGLTTAGLAWFLWRRREHFPEWNRRLAPGGEAV